MPFKLLYNPVPSRDSPPLFLCISASYLRRLPGHGGDTPGLAATRGCDTIRPFMTLESGFRLDRYEIVEMIGKGGMGEVYRATDTRLPREVAIKTSQQQFNERFARETKVIASLNHPNICTLFDVGPNYLVMEMIEGPTLSERIKAGPMSVEEATAIMRQVAEALEYAHERGVVHRDLKPGNIKIRPDGVVKVLDFGLAKVGPALAASGDPENSPTITMAATQAGVVVGTAAYMSPEQAMGKAVDKRADVWSFGVVFYELLAGARMHTGGTVQEVLASVLKDEPDLKKVPPQAHRLLKRCLDKDPNKRLRHVGDFLALLDDAPGPPTHTGTQAVIPAAGLEPPAKAQGSSWLWPALTAALAAALVITAWVLWPKPAGPARATRFQVKLPDNVTFNEYVSLSPDGHKLVFTSRGEQGGIWVHDLDTLSWRLLPETRDAVAPFWSPDSRFLAFASGRELKKIEIPGGPPQTLTTVSGNVGSGAWNRNGVIIFGNRGGGNPLWRVSASGGVATQLTEVDRSRGEQFHSLPSFLPDGKHFIYLHVGTSEGRGIYAGSLDLKPAEQPKERILATQFGAPYVDGNIFFMRDGTLMTQPFDDIRLQLTGEAIPVAEHVGTSNSTGTFSVSPTGVLAFRSGPAPVLGSQATWFDRQGKQTGTFGEIRGDIGYVLSPDGTRVAVRDAPMAQAGDIWISEFARGVRTRLTFRQSQGSYAVWSADGNRIIFAGGTTLDALYEKASSGAGEEKELLKKAGEAKTPSSWSRDGRFLLYATQGGASTGADMWVLALAGDRKPVLLLATDFNEGLASFSPDARWIAYTSTESGRNEIYVRPFDPAGPALGQGKWQISKDGGAGPKWRADGREIVFRAPDGAPMSVDVSGSGAAFQAGAPRQLFAAPAGLGDWDVTADGKRFLMAISPSQRSVDEPITVVLNWKASRKR
jgi:Tol biopolymer transport system component/predicted Ser/Thr protein kinase